MDHQKSGISDRWKFQDHRKWLSYIFQRLNHHLDKISPVGRVPDKSGSRVISCAMMYFCPTTRELHELHDPELNAKIHG